MKQKQTPSGLIKKSSRQAKANEAALSKWFLFFILLVSGTFIQAQCAMCRASLESAGDQQLAEGINNGIIFLMAIPYILVAVLGYFIVRMLRKNRIQKPS
jgi:heme/copper-type cytochrome/quinol oxidase subunit 2